ncbi:MAG: hypothetical protein AAGD43_30390 [Pseudomonadota bacterium]
MFELPSLLSFAAAGIYCVTGSVCAIAGSTARTKRQDYWHVWAWCLIALLFSALAFSRILSLEDILRADLRDWLRVEGAISSRRVWQGYALAAAILISAVAGLLGFFKLSRITNSRRDVAVGLALTSCGAMLALIVVRVISLHAVDQLLYGRFKLNWIGDLGLTVTVVFAAAFYVQTVRSRPK